MKSNTCLTVIIIVAAIALVIGLGSAVTYNSLVRAEKLVDEAKAQIEVVCQRRLDLIPNLVETVKGYAKHERETLVAVSQARSKAQGILDALSAAKSMSKEQMAKLTASQSELTTSLKSLFALVENYPTLKANTSFVTLQDQLEGTENRISVARQRYNHSVRLYNTKVAMFPQNIVASVFGFEEKDNYFEAAEEAESSVAVKF